MADAGGTGTATWGSWSTWAAGNAVADPLHVPVTGALAKILTRAYHLYALPGNRLRVATDWFNDIVEHRPFVQLGLVPEPVARLAAAERTDIYFRSDGSPLHPALDAGSAALDQGPPAR